MAASSVVSGAAASVTVRPLLENDLSAADRIFRMAFGTFLGLPDPMRFFESADYVRSRWRADPSGGFAAEYKGELVGTNFATNWGSVGFFGPLTVRPDLWDHGIGRRLIPPVMQRFSDWKIRHAGLFTFAHSAKHIHLYQAFGFWPRSLTAVAAKPVNQSVKSVKAVHFSTLNPKEQDACLVECRRLTGQILEGLDLAKEIRAVRNLNLGETLILSGKDGLEAFAICHCGPGTEAGANTCYIKFGAVRPGSQSGTVFEQMLDACETMAHERGMTRLVAGVNYAREQAAESLFSRGFKTEIQGVVMQRPNQAGYNRPGVYLLDDWR